MNYFISLVSKQKKKILTQICENDWWMIKMFLVSFICLYSVNLWKNNSNTKSHQNIYINFKLKSIKCYIVLMSE